MKTVEERKNEIREDIKFHIENGLYVDSAIEIVLEESCLSASIKNDLRKEFKIIS